jgi:hypothetical protein
MHSSLDLPSRQRCPSNGQSQRLANAVGTAAPWLLRCVDWFSDRAHDTADISSGAWTALAAWLAVAVGIAALVYAWRQYQRARQQAEEVLQPQVAMFMEPSASDWHLIELVVKNFGRTPAYGIRFEFANPPTVGKYESAYEDRYVDIAPLNLPAEIPYLAPTQEWRIVWDSALDRRELGEGHRVAFRRRSHLLRPA